MKLLLLWLFQSSLLLPPRLAMENPSAVSPIPQKLRKDYDKLWARFTAGKDDPKLIKDLDKFLQKQKTFDPGWVIQGYLSLYAGNDNAAQEKFNRVLAINPNNRIAVYYLAELANTHGDYAQAAGLYTRLQSLGSNDQVVATKRQRALLLATDNLLRSAAKAEGEDRLAEAEDYYRQALKIAPNEPSLRVRLADLLVKQNKKEEGEAERKAAADLGPPRAAKSRGKDEARIADLEDLGRWGADIEVFHSIRDAEALTREQLAVLLVRYFPQVTELQQRPQILTDIENSPRRTEIQTVTGLQIVDARPNRSFRPEEPVTRADFAKALARLSRLLGVSGSERSPISAQDVAPTSIMYPDVQLVLGSGLMTLEDSGSFGVAGRVSGRQAVRSAEQLLLSFQQLQR